MSDWLIVDRHPVQIFHAYSGQEQANTINSE